MGVGVEDPHYLEAASFGVHVGVEVVAWLDGVHVADSAALRVG